MRRQFLLEHLPNPALEVLFEGLSYAEIATACCVSRAWNRTLCTQNRWLWSSLVFDTDRLGVSLSAAAVRAVASKARDELRSVTFRDANATLLYENEAGTAAGVLLGLCATAPTLAHVGVPQADLAMVRDMLEASPCLARLDVACLFLGPEDVMHHQFATLVTHPAVRVKKLEMRSQDMGTSPAALLLSAVAVMHTQTAWLEAVSVFTYPYTGMVVQRCSMEDEAGQALVAAVAACPRLKDVHMPRLLASDTYERVAHALAAHGDLSEVTVSITRSDALHYLGAVFQHLTPAGLGHLSLSADDSRLMPVTAVEALDAIIQHLPSATTLRKLTITCGDFGGHELLEARVWPVLASCESLKSLEVRGVTSELLEMIQTLPAGLTSLSLCGTTERGLRPNSDNLRFDVNLAKVLRKARHVTSLTLSDFVWGPPEFWALANHVRSSKCKAHNLVLNNVMNRDQVNMDQGNISTGSTWSLLASALWCNESVSQLTIRPVPDECAKALADGLRGARWLRELTLGINLAPPSCYLPGPGGPLSHEGVGALVNGFQHNDSLSLLRVVAFAMERPEHITQLRALMKRTVHMRAAQGNGKSSDQVQVIWEGQS